MYTGAFKQKLSSLTRDQILEYLKEGKLVVDGVELQEGWLKISKEFND